MSMFERTPHRFLGNSVGGRKMSTALYWAPDFRAIVTESGAFVGIHRRENPDGPNSTRTVDSPMAELAPKQRPEPLLRVCPLNSAARTPIMSRVA